MIIEWIVIEFIAGNRDKKFALINLSLNFCETTRNNNKVILENLVEVHNSKRNN